MRGTASLSPKLIAAAGATAVFILVSLVIALVLLAAGGGFSAGDLPVFAYWTVFLALLLGLLVRLFLQLAWRWNALLQYVVGTALGLVLGLGLTVGVAIALGPWFANFSFPVVYCWLPASVAGFEFAVSYHHPKTRLVALMLFLVMGGLAVVEAEGLLPSPAGVRQPEFLVYFKPGATNAQIESFSRNVLGRPAGSESLFIDGVCQVSGGSYVAGSYTLSINFRYDTTEQQRQAVRQAVTSSPYVVKVEQVPPVPSGPLYLCGSGRR